MISPMLTFDIAAMPMLLRAPVGALFQLESNAFMLRLKVGIHEGGMCPQNNSQVIYLTDSKLIWEIHC